MKKLLIPSVGCLIIAALIVLAAPPTPCTFWSWQGNSKLNGQPLPVGAVIKAYDPNNVLCGQYTIATSGQFFFDCQGDDPDTSGVDEGADSGDTIKFYINNILSTVISGSAVWQSGYQEINIEATSAGVCTNNDDCNYLDTACADGVCNAGTCESQFKSAATLCRASGGGCDVAEYCTGSSASCPTDAKSTAQCRAASGVCDVAESCDGVNNDCPADAFRPNTYECRASAGVCDIADKCTGSTATCPSDAKSTAQCRAASGECDMAESCDGINNNCPTDSKATAGTSCGLARDCPADSCNGFFAEFYPVDGHDTCDGNGNCNVYSSCALETKHCSDNNANDGINGLTCGAPCDQDVDCSDNTCSQTYDDYCNGRKLVEYDNDKTKDSTTVTDSCGNTCEDDCTCTNCITDCSAPATNAYCVKSVCTAECAVDADCNDGDDFTIDRCLESCACQHQRVDCVKDSDCNDGNLCTNEICNLATYKCQYTNNNNPCDDSAYCTVNDACTNGACVGAARSCSANNIAKIATCNNNPDNLPFTWDYRAAFTSTCDEANDKCTTGDATITHTRDKARCGAECEQDTDCTCQADKCTVSDGDGLIDDWVDYPEHGTCQNEGTCTGCTPAITKHDIKCKTVMKIPLEKGIGMFSLPLVPETNKKFSDIQNGCSFNPITNGQGIAYWDPTQINPVTGDHYFYKDANAILYPGQGYFTYQQNDCDFTIEGYKFTMDYVGYLNTDNIYSGWNMIASASDGINDFDTVEGTCNVVSGPWIYNPRKGQYVRTQVLEPGKGYYIKTTNNCKLG